MKAAEVESARLNQSNSEQPADDMREISVERIWKELLVDCMRSVAPDFRIDDRNRILMGELYKYVHGIKGGRLDTRKGLLLWGGVGTGKTTVMKGLRAYVASINRMTGYRYNRIIGIELLSASGMSLRYSNEGMTAMFRWIDRGAACDLCIDEVGREDLAKYFGTPCDVVRTVLQSRYEFREEWYTHMTTNMDMNDGREFRERFGDWIYDRAREMFNIIHMGGDSRRK